MPRLPKCNLGDTDKEFHGYLPFYEHHINPGAVTTLTEIGVYSGGSLRMWARWMPHADIFGIDIEPANYVVQSDPPLPNIHFMEGDATTIAPWSTDVLIDDGSHQGDEQTDAFVNWWPMVTPGGWYVIEDLETVWAEQFRGGHLMESFLSHRMHDALRDRSIGRDVAELHAYPQILFLRKIG